jgi:hypothetical protein
MKVETPRYILNMKLKEDGPRGRTRSRWKQQVTEDVTQKQERGRKQKGSGLHEDYFAAVTMCGM